MNKQEKLTQIQELAQLSEEQLQRFGNLHSEDLDIIVTGFTKNKSLIEELGKADAEIDSLKERISAKDAEIDSLKEVLKDPMDTPTPSKKPGEAFEFRGVKYKFRDTAPRSIRYNNVVYTQRELIEDENILLQLVGGNSSLITKQ